MRERFFLKCRHPEVAAQFAHVEHKLVLCNRNLEVGLPRVS
jgi:hypothetical protein